MRVIKQLYGIAKSGLFWWETYHRHHLEEMAMMTSTFDPCLLVTDFDKAPNDECFGVIAMQTDDTLILATSKFNDLEETKLAFANFVAKPKIKLTTDQKLQFNGCTLIFSNGALTIRQKGQGTKLELIPEKDEDFQRINVQQRVKGAYIASKCHQEASFNISKAAQNYNPDKFDCNELNKRLQWQMNILNQGIKYIDLNLHEAALFVFVDGAFTNNKDLSSQIGYIIYLANEKNISSDYPAFKIRGNIIHWSPTKCKRITRSVLASEIYGMARGFVL